MIDRCLWDEINLEDLDDMFLQMIELLHHLGLACHMPLVDEKVSLLVPWFLTEYPDPVEAIPESLPEDQVNCLCKVGMPVFSFRSTIPVDSRVNVRESEKNRERSRSELRDESTLAIT